MMPASSEIPEFPIRHQHHIARKRLQNVPVKASDNGLLPVFIIRSVAFFVPSVEEQSVFVSHEKRVMIVHLKADFLRPDDLKFIISDTLPRKSNRCDLKP